MNRCVVSWTWLCLAMLLVGRAAAAEEKTGEQLYRKLCASCHGAAGEGTEEHYPNPLAGDRSLGELTQYIDESMPEKNPQLCVGEDARLVSAFVYEQFYSPVAQARNRPARVELSRLTVRQYQQAIADLLSDRDGPEKWPAERGLRGEYYKSRRFRDSERILDRIDPVIRFDFAESSPAPEKIDPAEFGIRWDGSVIAPDSGEYEFNLRTVNGARLWINDLDRPLIDAWVRSGTELDHRESVHLLGGRAYPIRIEYFKSKEAKERTASVELEWTVPRLPAEPVPQRFLLPVQVASTYVVRTPFPPDDRSVGYERGSSISRAWDQAATSEALEVADYVAAQLPRLAGISEEESSRAERAQEYCRRLAERAFRRPLTDELAEFIIRRPFTGDATVEMAVKRAVLVVLKSPRFLYREIEGQGDGYDIAARLSFGMWDSLPDRTLLEAAKNGELTTREQVQRQAERMLDDPRTRAKVREFLLQWLKVDHVPDVAKDPSRYPEFTPAVAADLRSSLDLFLADVVWSQESDFRQLLLADSLYLNGRLAEFYGVELPADAPFQRVSMDANERAGVLPHPYLMAGFAYSSTSSPIHRGVFIARSVLGRYLRQPPEAVAPLLADLHPDLTTRERVALQTRPEACQSCHAMLNPLGFGLEHFDAVGRFRREEQGKPVDASGNYLTRHGQLVHFSGVRDLANFLATSEETHAAFIEQLFHYLVKQPIRAYGPEQLPKLKVTFAENSYSMQRLIVDILASTAIPTPR